MYKLVFFDMDGTLLNTLSDLAAACNYALADGGFPAHEDEKYKDFIGRGPVYLVESALPMYARSEAVVADTRRIFEEYYSKHSMDLTKPYDGMTDVLKAVRSAGVKIMIYSNKPHDIVVALSELFFEGLYDFAVGFRDGVPPKPAPDTGLDLMRRFGVTAGESVYVGDSGIDMLTAKNIGVYAVGVAWGFCTRTDLKTNCADVIIDKVSDLSKIIIDKPPAT